MSFLTTASFVDPKLESEDLRSFLHATQIVEILFALLYIGFISVAAMSFLPMFDSYASVAAVYLLTNIMLLVFFRKTRYFLADSKLALSIRKRVMIAGNAIVVFVYVVSTYAMLECGIFSAGFCFQFVLPLMAIAMTGSKSSCIFFGAAGIATQQFAVALQELGHPWPRAIFHGTASFDLLMFNAFLCVILNLFIIEISVRFAQSHKKANDVMQTANERAKKLLEDHVTFIANATHELRTPVLQILGLVDLLDSLNKDFEVKALIDTLRSATMGTVQLVNNVLDYEKIGKGMVKLEPCPFDIRELVKRLLNMSAIQAHSKQIELMAVTSERVPNIVIGDQMRLYQILQNLMSNSIKFSVPREKTNEILVKVESEMDLSDRSKLKLVISIKDTGIGLSRDCIPTLFQAFHQASLSTTRIFGGTGLGLAISRNLARAMNGDISVYSDGPGKGTTFNVNVEVGEHSSYHEMNHNLLLVSGTVVIFDDVPTALSLLENAIRQIGYEVQCFTSFSAMINFLSSQHQIPKLIMVDVGTIGASSESIPGPTRLEVIRNLDVVYGSLPVVALKDQDIMLTVSSPYTVYYSKPIVAEQIQSIVLSALSANKPSSEINAISDISAAVDFQKARPLHVLLVDDNPVSLKVIGRMIEQLGHHVTVCTSGQSAIQILIRDHTSADYPGQLETTTDKYPLDVIMTDYLMPETNGIQLIQNVRRYEQERPGSKMLPIILTSGTPRATIQAELDSCRMVYFLLKPFSLRDLQNTLDMYCDDCDNPVKTFWDS